MTPEQWAKIESIFNQAIELPAAERERFLETAYGNDLELRREVESLIAQAQRKDESFDKEFRDAVADELHSYARTSFVGKTIGHFEIVSLLGKGGMGEVYKATDKELKRHVAIKVLPPAFAADSDRLSRFQREAELLASLNHPHIAVVYGIECSDNTRSIVMEMVEGETLAERIAKSAIPVKEALKIAAQIAEALQAAHEKGVIHRDLKPANIMVTPEGRVKILDFGLAKMFQATPADLTAATGTILGTPSYMSPEQARGHATDKRSDIWAFACVLYEMLTARKPFEGESVADIVTGVLEKQPDWTQLPLSTPSIIRSLLKRCLNKDARERLQDIADARFLITEAMTETTAAPITPKPHSTSVWIWRVAISALILLAGVTLGRMIYRSPSGAPSQNIARFSLGIEPAVMLNQDHSLLPPSRQALDISPDGQYVAFAATRGQKQELFVRKLDEAEAKPISSTDRVTTVFFSPDSKWIGFTSQPGRIQKAPIGGGPPSIVHEPESATFGASWSMRDTMLFGHTDGSIWEIPASGGGAPRQLTKPNRANGEFRYVLPRALPDGRHMLFTLRRSHGWDDADIVIQSLETGKRHTLIRGGSDGRYVSTGHLLFMRKNTLMAIRFDLQTRQTMGEPVAVIDKILSTLSLSYTAQSGTGHFSVSNSGTLVFLASESDPLSEDVLVITDRRGKELQQLPVHAVEAPRFSPDGQKIAFSDSDAPTSERHVRVYDLKLGTKYALTSKGRNHAPVWSPDSQRIAFHSDLSGRTQLFVTDADGTGQPSQLVQSESSQIATSWSNAGLVYLQGGYSAPFNQIRVMSMGDPNENNASFVEEPTMSKGDMSLDGTLLVYSSPSALSVRSRHGDRHVVAEDQTATGAWARHGNELFFSERASSGGGHRFFHVDISTQPTLKIGAPNFLFEGNYRFSGMFRSWDVSPDGQRFLLVRRKEVPKPITQIQVILNWHEELTRRVPVN